MSTSTDFFTSSVPNFWNRRKYRVNSSPGMYFVPSSECRIRDIKIRKHKFQHFLSGISGTGEFYLER